MNVLPKELVNYIYDELADYKNYWKSYFNNNILNKIDISIRKVGFICILHKCKLCTCNKMYLIPCIDCYCYGKCNIIHIKYKNVSFDNIKNYHPTYIKSPYIPKNLFIEIYDGSLKSKKKSMLYNNFRLELDQLPFYRLELIKKYGESYKNEKNEMKILAYYKLGPGWWNRNIN